MKFVHAADLHLDSPLLALSRQDARQVERMRRATREAFEHLIDLCIEQEVALLVLAGDLYDHDCL
jgi:exonuclease SbcD